VCVGEQRHDGRRVGGSSRDVVGRVVGVDNGQAVDVLVREPSNAVLQGSGQSVSKARQTRKKGTSANVDEGGTVKSLTLGM